MLLYFPPYVNVRLSRTVKIQLKQNQKYSRNNHAFESVSGSSSNLTFVGTTIGNHLSDNSEKLPQNKYENSKI